MKHHWLILASVLLGASIPAQADETIPAVSARQAITIAEESLANRGLEKQVFVQSVTLERATIMKAKSYWFVKWSHSLPASDPKNRELGVKVNMDGSAVRLVKEPGV
jgi:hypothetical protein